MTINLNNPIKLLVLKVCKVATSSSVNFFNSLNILDWVKTRNKIIKIKKTLSDKCPNTELFLVCIFPHSHWIRRDTYLSVFSPNAGKYGPEITQYLNTFHAVRVIVKLHSNIWDWSRESIKSTIFFAVNHVSSARFLF